LNRNGKGGGSAVRPLKAPSLLRPLWRQGIGAPGPARLL